MTYSYRVIPHPLLLGVTNTCSSSYPSQHSPLSYPPSGPTYYRYVTPQCCHGQRARIAAACIYVQVDDENSTTKFLGWVVASYSFGQLIAAPFFGTWADHRPTMEPLVVAIIINIVFNVVYSYLWVFGSGVAGWMMIASRSLVGFGAGLIGGREGGRGGDVMFITSHLRNRCSR